MDDLDTLAQRLAYARKRRGWSRNRLATEAGMVTSLVRQIETHAGGGNPTVTTAARLAAVLGVSIDWLVTGAGPGPVGATS